MRIEIISNSKEMTMDIGKTLAKYLFKGSVITLSGDLGAGKTTFTKGVGLGIGIKEEINSPTFNILKCYFNDNLNLYHIDAYRLEDVDEDNKNIGLEEVIEGNGVCIIEWPAFINSFIPFDSMSIEITNLEGNERKMVFSSLSPKYESIMKMLKEAY